MKYSMMSMTVYSGKYSEAKSNGATMWRHVVCHVGRTIEVNKKAVVLPGSNHIIEFWGDEFTLDYINFSEGEKFSAEEAATVAYSFKSGESFTIFKAIVEAYDWKFAHLPGTWRKMKNDHEYVETRDKKFVETSKLIFAYVEDEEEINFSKSVMEAEMRRHWRELGDIAAREAAIRSFKLVVDNDNKANAEATKSAKDEIE